MTEPIGVAVVVPVLNGHEHLPALLNAIAAQERLPDEVVVVKGGPAEAARAALAAFEQRHPNVRVRLIPNPRKSIPAALNLGIEAAQREVILRMDAHGGPAPDYIRRCLTVLEDSGADVVGGRWQIVPGAAGVAAQAIALAAGHPLGAGDARYRSQSTARAGDVDTLPYGCFRKSLWAQLGGFDESLLTNEDYEFNWRVRAAGRRVYFDPAICSLYPARESFAALAEQYFRYGWWKAQMLRRHPTSVRWRQWLPMLALAVLGSAAGLAPFSPVGRVAFGAIVAGYVALLTSVGAWFAIRHRSPALCLGLPVAFAVIHFGWSGGAWANWLSGGRWPRWPLRQSRASAAASESPSPRAAADSAAGNPSP